MNLIDLSNRFATAINERIKQIPIQAVQDETGEIKVVYYQSQNLIHPVISDILEADLIGTTAVLTKTNEESFLIAHNLVSKGVQAKLVKAHDAFNLRSMEEVHFFLEYFDSEKVKHTMAKDIWKDAKKLAKDKFSNSHNYEVLERLVSKFERLYPKTRFKSDLEQFIHESKIEDFISTDSQSILVTTMHKSKGKEFDNVFILLKDFQINTEENKRLLYVALTRAKSRLHIHSNRRVFDNIPKGNLEIVEDSKNFEELDELELFLDMRDVNLGYFEYVQHRVKNLHAGLELSFNEEGCTLNANDFVLKFSKSFKQKLNETSLKSYTMVNATINFTLYWWVDEEKTKEVKVLLPKVTFRKSNNSAMK